MINEIICGDAFEVLKQIPDESIDLVITDPPYFRMKTCWWDRQWDDKHNYLKWLAAIADEWRRILKSSGSLYCFASSVMAASVEVLLSERFEVLNHIVWEKQNEPGYDGWKQKCSKESLRKWYAWSERVIFAEQIAFRNVLRNARLDSGLTAKALAELIGAYGKVNHGGSVSNWETGKNVPTPEQYEKLSKVLDLPPRETIIRPFNVSSKVQYTDVWHFDTVKQRKGKHPCEKPIDMINHMITASSVKDSIVLDCFCGSGVVLAEAKRLKRKYVGIEIEQKWIEIAKQRVGEIGW
jgi:adenine-specific DNA-methyltransferase